MDHDLTVLILDAISHFGDASTGQIAAWIKAPTEDVSCALTHLLRNGQVQILPRAGTWALA